jgi:hypothetical protein
MAWYTQIEPTVGLVPLRRTAGTSTCQVKHLYRTAEESASGTEFTTTIRMTSHAANPFDGNPPNGAHPARRWWRHTDVEAP